MTFSHTNTYTRHAHGPNVIAIAIIYLQISPFTVVYLPRLVDW